MGTRIGRHGYGHGMGIGLGIEKGQGWIEG